MAPPLSSGLSGSWAREPESRPLLTSLGSGQVFRCLGGFWSPALMWRGLYLGNSQLLCDYQNCMTVRTDYHNCMTIIYIYTYIYIYHTCMTQGLCGRSRGNRTPELRSRAGCLLLDGDLHDLVLVLDLRHLNRPGMRGGLGWGSGLSVSGFNALGSRTKEVLREWGLGFRLKKRHACAFLEQTLFCGCGMSMPSLMFAEAQELPD